MRGVPLKGVVSLVLFLLVPGILVYGQRSFRNPELGIERTIDSSVAWGDFDSDGDQDFAYCGSEIGSSTILTKVFTNKGNSIFEDSGILLPGAHSGDLHWVDYDNDGDVDLFITGAQDWGESLPLTRIYRNDQGELVDSGIEFIDVYDSNAAWGDYNNDGALDLLISGKTRSETVTILWKNNNDGTFEDSGITLPQVAEGGLAFGDYDNDGWLDIFLSGTLNGSIIGTSQVLKNESGQGFFDTGIDLLPSIKGNLGVGDFNNDGFVDLFISEIVSFTDETALYLNDGAGDFVEQANPNGLFNLATAWDYDGDGDLDLLGLSNVYKNLGDGTFEREDSNYQNIGASDVEWADYDGDKDLDFLVVGDLVRLYQNSGGFSSTTIDNFGLYFASSDLGDFDNDGDLDLVSSGASALDIPNPINPVSKIYRNNGLGEFMVDGIAGLEGAHNGDVAWGDAEGDGDLDLLVTGINSFGEPSTELFINEGGIEFNKLDHLFVGVWRSRVDWGDYDNDGDLDFIVTGASVIDLFDDPITPVAYLYENLGDLNFVRSASFQGTMEGSVHFGDHDGDGDLDILLSGATETSNFGVLISPVTLLYQNDGDNQFTRSGDFLGITQGESIWGDLDNDGDLDIVQSGVNDTEESSHIYLNQGDGTYLVHPFPTKSYRRARLKLADMDHDGLTDILISSYYGEPNYNFLRTIIYTNSGDLSFSEELPASFHLWGSNYGDFEVGLLDEDHDLDIITVGLPVVFYNKNLLYNNEIGSINTPPEVPTNLSALPEGNGVRFSWDATMDDHTPSQALSYTILVRDKQTGQYLSGMVDIENSKPLRSGPGNLVAQTTWLLENLPEDIQLTWSVQAIDASYAYSSLASESEVELVTSLKEPESKIIAIYPNPFQRLITIQADANFGPIKSYSIIDSYGRVLRQSQLETPQYELNLEMEFETGFYYITIRSIKGESTRKLIKY